ncbi:MAG: aldehyde-activating protein [Oceanobacter sp.]|nr:MAG: aldehyde-activating protein [Oceanobacter sp.]
MSGSELNGSCHCGAVQITVAEPPPRVLRCNCTLCRKTGWRGGYWHPDAVRIEAPPQGLNPYIQGDRTITSWTCKRCGCFTHWTPLTASPDQMGVNMRMFDPADWHHLPVREVDGASL